MEANATTGFLTNQRPECPYSHSEASLFWPEQIANDSAAKRETASTSDATEEPEHDQGADIRRQSTPDLPTAEEHVGGRQDRPPPVDLTHRRHDHRADDITEQVDTDGHGPHDLLRLAELDHQ